jgi:hypothetical protein
LYLEKKETFPGSNCEFSRETNGKTKVNGLYLEKKETSPGSNCEFSREANGKTKNSAGEFRERKREREREGMVVTKMGFGALREIINI